MAEAQEVATWRRRRSGHPLLRGCKRDKYTHGLHPAQMEALRAVCGALIPSLPVVVEGHQGDDADHGRGSKDVERLYLASAADGNIPDEVTCSWAPIHKYSGNYGPWSFLCF
jgi:long-chain-alcohol oxidase